MQSFSSSAKIKVRQEDLYLVHDLYTKANRKLSYLGLPSPWMGDVTAWKPYLAKIYAIEHEKAYLPHLMDKAYVLGFIEQFTYFFGNIDAISKTQLDKFGQSFSTIFPVDLINLDYCDGLDYQSFSKLDTLESLILRQKEALVAHQLSVPYFIVLLTHNIPSHEGNPGEKIKYLKFLTKDINLFRESLKKQIQSSLEWYISDECPPAYQHKCFVLGKMFECAQSNGFKAIPQKVIQYSGDKGAVMIHYQFRVTPVDLGSPVPTYNKMNCIDIMNYRVVDENGDNIVSNYPFISQKEI